MSEANKDNCHSCCNLGMTFAHLLTRLFVALRLVLAGIDKFRGGDGANVSFNLDNYTAKTDRIAKLMSENSFLPASLCGPYAHTIGYVLLVVGIWTAIGIMTEFSLLAAGLTFLSLAFGLGALPDDTEVVYRGIEILTVAAALVTAKHKGLSADGILFGRKKD